MALLRIQVPEVALFAKKGVGQGQLVLAGWLIISTSNSPIDFQGLPLFHCMKKVFYFSISLLLLVLIFLAAYNFAFKNNANDPAAPSKVVVKKQENPLSNDPPVSSSIVSPINESILGAEITQDGAIVYYSLDDRSLKKATTEGKDKTVLLSNLPGTPIQIVWAPKKDKALLSLKQESGGTLWHFADLTTKTLVPLKPEMSRIVWNNLGDKIFYQYTDQKNGGRTLNVASPDGTDWKTLTTLKNDSFIASIPKSTAISFWNKPNALEKTFFESIGLNGENRKILLTEKYGADYLWSPNGERVLVSSSVEKGGNTVLLSSMNSAGGELQSLSIPTLISKTVWSKDNTTLYYALPGSIPENSMFPNDYFEKPIATKDTFWKVDTATGKQTRLVDLKDIAENFDSIDFLLSPNEDILFFTERTTRRLYRIDL